MLAEGIEDLVEYNSRLGEFTSVALVHLVVASLYRAANEHRGALHHQRDADGGIVDIALMPRRGGVDVPCRQVRYGPIPK